VGYTLSSKVECHKNLPAAEPWRRGFATG